MSRRGQLKADQLGPVEVIVLRGDVLKVNAKRPLPPGTRLSLLRPDTDEVLVQGKIVSLAADRPAKGLWEVSIKLFAPSTSARALLVALLDHH